MSYNRLPYDTCAYEQVLAETTAPGIYKLSTPPVSCRPCHSTDVFTRLQSSGVSMNKNSHLIDIDSELIGITRNQSRCPERKYMPMANASGLCGAQTGNGVPCQKSAKLCVDHQKNHLEFKDCFEHTNPTRLSDLNCRRGVGINRWEFLCRDPQKDVQHSFDFDISTRILAKDNHRPCVPKPMSQTKILPTPTNDPVCENITPVCGVPMLNSTQWASRSRFY